MVQIQWRFVYTFVCFFGLMLVYMLRVNISVALVSMVNSTMFKPKNSTSECRIATNETLSEKKSGNFFWTEDEQALVLGAFYWGYALMQIPSGILSLYISAKWIYGLSTVITAFLTFLVPVASSLGVYYLVALRFTMGLFEGPSYPSLFTLSGRWILESESSYILPFMVSGGSIGTIMGQTLAGIIAAYLGWEWIFYIMGMAGCAWFIVYVIVVSNRPSEHPFISEEEKKMLIENISANHLHDEGKKLKVPWIEVMTSKPFLALLTLTVTYNFTWYTMINCLPYYMGEVLGFNISQNGLLSSAPFVIFFIFSMISGFSMNYLNSKKLFSKTKLRKLFACSGVGIACILQYCIPLANCNVNAAVTLVCFAIGIIGWASSVLAVNYFDLSPTLAGSLLSVINFFSTICGIVSPFVKGYFTRTGETRDNWSNIFITASSLLVFGDVVFLLFASASLQPWGLPDFKCEEAVDCESTEPLLSSKMTNVQ